MTFDELVQEAMDRLNLTSEDARTRVSGRINDRYRRVTSSIGIITSRRVTRDITINPAVSTSLPDYTVVDMGKVLKVSRQVPGERLRLLDNCTYDDVSNLSNVRDGLPNKWAVKRMGSTSTTITLDAYDHTNPFTLKFEGYELTDVLADDAEPAFPADFHDILVEGAMSDELRKMEKSDLAQIAENKYEQRLSDLRMFIAKSAYLDMIQGGSPSGNSLPSFNGLRAYQYK